ncbi:hypothetical protein DI53_1211 [Sphingobacterium deserti]|uniref:Uncharacterized protein n=1 Tax=Sphingobacterium deserti TaxID=1229276 RepID=A0A0B8T8K1_9SPHI|nr:hypothetical protein DI53_1211 [Sphingobacterium deserti]
MQGTDFIFLQVAENLSIARQATQLDLAIDGYDRRVCGVNGENK